MIFDLKDFMGQNIHMYELTLSGNNINANITCWLDGLHALEQDKQITIEQTKVFFPLVRGKLRCINYIVMPELSHSQFIKGAYNNTLWYAFRIMNVNQGDPQFVTIREYLRLLKKNIQYLISEDYPTADRLCSKFEFIQIINSLKMIQIARDQCLHPLSLQQAKILESSYLYHYLHNKDFAKHARFNSIPLIIQEPNLDGEISQNRSNQILYEALYESNVPYHYKAALYGEFFD